MHVDNRVISHKFFPPCSCCTAFASCASVKETMYMWNVWTIARQWHSKHTFVAYKKWRQHISVSDNYLYHHFSVHFLGFPWWFQSKSVQLHTSQLSGMRNRDTLYQKACRQKTHSYHPLSYKYYKEWICQINIG